MTGSWSNIKSAEVIDEAHLSASSSSSSPVCWSVSHQKKNKTKKAYWFTSMWPKTLFYVWSQTHRSFAFSSLFSPFIKKKRKKRKDKLRKRTLCPPLPLTPPPSPPPPSPPSPHQLWSLVLIGDVAVYTLAKKNKKKTMFQQSRN